MSILKRNKAASKFQLIQSKERKSNNINRLVKTPPWEKKKEKLWEVRQAGRHDDSERDNLLNHIIIEWSCVKIRQLFKHTRIEIPTTSLFGVIYESRANIRPRSNHWFSSSKYNITSFFFSQWWDSIHKTHQKEKVPNTNLLLRIPNITTISPVLKLEELVTNRVWTSRPARHWKLLKNGEIVTQSAERLLLWTSLLFFKTRAERFVNSISTGEPVYFKLPYQSLRLR